MKSTKFLTCKEEIKEYLGNISDYMFRKYISLGMPARLEKGGSWVAHVDNLEKWFQIYTQVNMRKALNIEEQKSEIEEQNNADPFSEDQR